MSIPKQLVGHTVVEKVMAHRDDLIPSHASGALNHGTDADQPV